MKPLLTILLILLLSAGICGADEISDLIPHIIAVESGGRENVINEKSGAVGLMQITQIVLTEYNMVNKGGALMYNLLEPEFNKVVGTWYLRRLKEHYLRENYTIERMLAAYNGGITWLRRLNYDISKMPKETRNYVRKVMKLYDASRNKQ